MKKLVFFAFILLAGCRADEQIQFADGTHTQPSHWDGRWLVINYWAEWCGPCRHEIPELNQLHEDRVGHGLVVLAVNWDGLPGDKQMEVIERMGIDFPVLVKDPFMQYGYDRPQQLPMTALISPDGGVHRVLFGPQTGTSILAAIR